MKVPPPLLAVEDFAVHEALLVVVGGDLALHRHQLREDVLVVGRKLQRLLQVGDALLVLAAAVVRLPPPVQRLRVLRDDLQRLVQHLNGLVVQHQLQVAGGPGNERN